VQLRIEVATRIVEEQGANKIFCKTKGFRHLRFAASFAHGRELFHFGEHNLYRFRERGTHAFVTTDHREHAHVSRGGKLDVDERHFLLGAELRERLTGSRIPIALECFERFVGYRGAGVVLLASGAWHMGYLFLTKNGRALLRDLLPRKRDFIDPIAVLKYNLGLSPTKPAFPRFSYIEKMEYWAMMWGSVLMGVTGVLLWFDNSTIGLFTKLGFDISRTVHFYEAVLATLSIVEWHFYFVIFNPDIYPMNLAWLTGRMSEKEMLEEHPVELARLKALEQSEPVDPSK
jgi:hypothetical protein